MASNPPARSARQNAWLPFAVTLAMVAAGLVAIPASATHVVPNPPWEEHLTIQFTGEPISFGEVPIGPNQKGRIVEVLVIYDPQDDDGPGPGVAVTGPTLTKLEFQVTEVGTGTSAQVIAWRADSRPFSSPDNWTVAVDNGGTTNELTFTARPGSGLLPFGRETFRLAVDATKLAVDPTPGQYDVTVLGYDAAGAIAANSMPPFRFVVENTPPQLLSATTRDVAPCGDATACANGHIDGYRLVFNEDMNCDSFFPEDFKVGGVGVLGLVPVADPLVPGPDPAPQESCRIIDMPFAESLVFDTDKRPAIQFTAGRLTDTAGNKATSSLGTPSGIAQATRDGAGPVLVGALSGPNANLVLASFSEPVRTNAQAAVNAANPAAAATFFTYFNSPTGQPQIIQTTAQDISTAEKAKVVQLNVSDAMGTNDLADRQNVRDTVCPTANIRDVLDTTFNPTPNAAVVPPVCRPIGPPRVDENLGPEINIWTRRLTVTFTTPVESNDPSGSLKPEHFSIVNTESSGGGPTGISSVQHTKGSDRAILTLQYEIARPTDVDQTPSYLRILPHVIKAAGTGTGTPFPVLEIEAGDYGMKDLTAPSILFAETADTDLNGKIDAFFLTFNEPISDDPADRRLPPANDQTTPGTLLIEGFPELLGPNPKRYRFDTGVEPDDNKAIIHFPEGAAVYNPYDPVTKEFRIEEQFPRGYTGWVPQLTTNGPGLFRDRACNPAPAGCDRNEMGGPDGERIDNFTVIETDGAAPRVLFADTQDIDKVQDGFLDGYRLIFSEQVLDSSFKAADWTVAGHVPEKVTTGAAANDHVFVLKFNQGTTPDTDAKPQVTYRCPGTCITPDGLPERGRGFQDLRLNAMQTLDEPALVEVDAARPVIVTAQGFVAQDFLNLVFSEPVDDGAGGPLVRADFFYSNVDLKGVTGFANSREVQHTAGAETAVLPLDRPLSESDISKDQLRANLDSIFELAAPHRTVPSTDTVGLGKAPDTTAPAQIYGLQVAVGGVLSNSVILSWIAPGDDGNDTALSLDDQDGYLVRASTSGPITATNFNAAEQAVVEFLPLNLTAPGAVQSAKVLNLTPETRYFFAVAAFDEQDNLGNVSESVEATTIADQTEPFGTLVVRSSTHVEGQPKANDDPKFTWNELTDPESTVIYRYAYNSFPEYEVKGTDNTTGSNTFLDLNNIPAGNWYLHVAAFSGGGHTQTFHYNFVVAYPVIEADEIIEADKAINATALRIGGDNVVGWALPEEDALPGTISGIRIWRLQDGEWLLIEEREGTYNELASGNVTDDSRHANEKSKYLVTAVYRDGQVGEDPPTTETYAGFGIANAADSIPLWVWIVLGVTGALILTGLIVFFALRSRSRREALEKEAAAGGYQWEEERKPSAVDPTTGLPIHEVKCPSCATQFKAPGKLPLQITCPSCGVQGTLN